MPLHFELGCWHIGNDQYQSLLKSVSQWIRPLGRFYHDAALMVVEPKRVKISQVVLFLEDGMLWSHFNLRRIGYVHQNNYFVMLWSHFNLGELFYDWIECFLDIFVVVHFGTDFTQINIDALVETKLPWPKSSVASAYWTYTCSIHCKPTVLRPMSSGRALEVQHLKWTSFWLQLHSQLEVQWAYSTAFRAWITIFPEMSINFTLHYWNTQPNLIIFLNKVC